MLLFWEAFACSLLTVPDDMTPGDALRLAAAENIVVVGNSVTITYRWLSGLGESLKGLPVVDPDRLAPALTEAARRARVHLAQPVDGTMLTVFDAAAESAGAALSEGSTPAETAGRMAADIRAALARHPVPLHGAWLGDPPEEDSGAFAARILLHGLCKVTAGQSGPPVPLHVPAHPAPAPGREPDVGSAAEADRESAPGTPGHPGHEVQAVVLADEPALRRLNDVPDVESLNVAENPLNPGLWHLHLHTARDGDPLAVLGNGITVLDYRVTSLRPPGTGSVQDADGPRNRVLVTSRDCGEFATVLGDALAGETDEVLAVLVRADPGEALAALHRERERRERDHLPALAAALIPCADEHQAARAAGAFRVTGDFPDTVLAMFNAARADVPGNDGRAAAPTPC